MKTPIASLFALLISLFFLMKYWSFLKSENESGFLDKIISLFSIVDVSMLAILVLVPVLIWLYKKYPKKEGGRDEVS